MEDADESKLFVGGISWQTTDETLREHFGKYGEVGRCVIAKDRITSTPRGFGFVCFSDSSAVNKALQDTHEILGRTVEVKKAIPRSEHPQNQQQHTRGFNKNSRYNGRSNDQYRTRKIFVGGLSANLTEKEFKSYFEQFGRITDVVVMHDNITHRPRGFGFITFDSEDSVENVMQKNFHELGGKLVEVKRAVPKEGSNFGSNSYDPRWCSGGQSTLNNYEHGNFPVYNHTYGMFPGYGPFSGGGGVMGYGYGGAFAGGYPSGGYSAMGYGMAPVMPSNAWNGPVMVAYRGSPLPYNSTTTVYPPYLNGVIGVMGGSVNDFNGNLGIGMNGKLNEVGGHDAQVAVDVSHGYKGSLDVNSSAQSYNIVTSRQNHRGNGGHLRSYSAGKSS